MVASSKYEWFPNLLESTPIVYSPSKHVRELGVRSSVYCTTVHSDRHGTDGQYSETPKDSRTSTSEHGRCAQQRFRILKAMHGRS